MLRPHLAVLSLVAAVFHGAPLPGQGRVLKVDPANASAYPNIGAAIAAAAPGDVLVVSAKPRIPGVEWSDLYPAIRIDKRLAITAEAGHDVRCWSAEITGLAAQDSVVIRGLHFERPTLLVGFGLPTLAVTDCHGHVFLEACTFRPATPVAVGVGPTFPAIDVRGPATLPRGSLSLVRCTVAGIDGYNNPRSAGQQWPAPGIRAVDTDLVVWNSTVTGGQGVVSYPQLRLPAGPGADAIVFDGYAFLSGCTVRGGAGGSGAAGTCTQGGDGGHGLVLTQGATQVDILGGTLAGGAAGAGCPPGNPGAADVRGAATVLRFPYLATSIEGTSPHRVGQTCTLTHNGAAGGAYAGFAALAPGLLRTLPFGVIGVHSLAGPGATLPLYGGAYGANGQSVLPVPLTPTGRDGTVVLLQTFAFLPPSPVASSAPTAVFILAGHL